MLFLEYLIVLGKFEIYLFKKKVFFYQSNTLADAKEILFLNINIFSRVIFFIIIKN